MPRRPAALPRGPLVSAEWLRENLLRSDLRVVDVRWYLQGKVGRDEYTRAHIPGAVFLDLDHDLSAANGPGRHPLPSPEQMRQVLETAGVGPDTTVVAYDDLGGSVAARLWFLMELYGRPGHCRVLDGGLAAWTAAGGELTARVPTPERATFETGAPRRGVVDKHGVESARHRRTTLLLDARAGERFRGEVEPVDARPGHIPGAASAPWAENLHEGRFRSAKELKARFKSLGVGPKTDVIAYCGSGVTACHNLLAMELAGIPRRRVRLYEGSWSDWARDAPRPAELGPGSRTKRGG